MADKQRVTIGRRADYATVDEWQNALTEGTEERLTGTMIDDSNASTPATITVEGCRIESLEVHP